MRAFETGCRCWVPGAGVGAVSWLRTWWRLGAGAGCCELACRCCGGDWVPVPGAGAGCVRSGDTPRCTAAFFPV